MLDVLPKMRNVMLLCSFIFLVFGIVGAVDCRIAFTFKHVRFFHVCFGEDGDVDFPLFS